LHFDCAEYDRQKDFSLQSMLQSSPYGMYDAAIISTAIENQTQVFILICNDLEFRMRKRMKMTCLSADRE
jgi:hypothetical protein